ncbi:M14 family metallopeptidase [Rhodohalobacter barkolensis]|uniref:Zinc carboxypeptidase n=1 Tax=Rhodohalobacter barkolensis TaxID=2053187 RepID=A0A2N0VE99_9BACT|nr:M14 family metallopeptidase [Rhodohalobacter barkolensis]PKD42524.1 zinc carboxypeptidase [Rhodohalobacter barkolensis]
MKKPLKSISAFLILFFISTGAFAQLQSPEEFLGYELGDRYTPHHRVLSYVTHVAENSDLVTIHKYGETYELRELVYLVVTSEENHSNIEEIRLNNLKLTGLEEGEATDNQKAITWLSYNVHGNETNSSEAAMKTLYELVDPSNRESKAWLNDSVVIIDPMINPDGRDRYVNWFNGMIGTEYNPNPIARELNEPWPGGRSNHYYFDMNRDWAWQTQVETQQRIAVYQQWMPHVHVDFHEMGYNSPYYFAPAAKPYHNVITDWQTEFQTTIGKNHTKYFDENSWLYYTREVFDLFYPSYGDTWPTYNGAIGMTYEKAGGGSAGAAVLTQEGDTLTLKDRLTHHHVAGISTIEVTAVNAERVVSEFTNYFNNAANDPAGAYKSFVIKADNNPDKVHHLLTFLDSQKIRYGTAGSNRNTNAYNFKTGENERVSISEDDIVVSVYQPQGQLARVFFEPNPELADSLTYDITTWEAHYRFGLDGFALESNINPEENISPDDYRNSEVSGADEPYAYVTDWDSMDDARFLAEITQKGVKSRFSKVDFEIEGQIFKKGSLIILRGNNAHLEDSFDEIVRAAADNHSRDLFGASTGFVTSGSDFGSNNVSYIEKPEVAVLMGEGTSSLSAGEVWHYFDQQLRYPTTLIDTDDFMRADLSDYNSLVLPSGFYNGVLTDSAIEKISSWVRSGGNLILIGNANRSFTSRNGFQLTQKQVESSEPTTEELLASYGERSRRSISTTTSGSAYEVTLDTTHPLAFGYDEEYYTLKLSANSYSYLDDGWNIGTVRENAYRSGFVGEEATSQIENSLSYGVQDYGSGQVVYMIENPLFRGFWENGKLMVANSIFFVGN